MLENEKYPPAAVRPRPPRPRPFYRSSKRRTLAIILSTTVKQMSVVVALSQRYCPRDIRRIVASKKIGFGLHLYLYIRICFCYVFQGKKKSSHIHYM